MIDNQIIANLLSFHGKDLDLKLVEFDEKKFSGFGHWATFKITKRAKKSKIKINVYWKLNGHHVSLWFWGAKQSPIIDLTDPDSAGRIQAFLALAKKNRKKSKKYHKKYESL